MGNLVKIELANVNYIPVQKESVISYGGSQMWFSDNKTFRKDSIIYNYGCGTIATADLFLYFALRQDKHNTSETKLAMKDSNSISAEDYCIYVRRIHDGYTHTKRKLAVLGPEIASAVNRYSKIYKMNCKASWKWNLSYWGMYYLMEEMLMKDIPVILSVGPNIPKLWGNKGIAFYSDERGKNSVKENINSHYVTVTGIIKDHAAASVILQISSWGKKYYVNYDEYRDYVQNFGTTYTSSIVYIQ